MYVQVCVHCNHGVCFFFQGLMKSGLVPVRPMEWASLSLPPTFFLFLNHSLSLSLSFSTSLCPLLSLPSVITEHRGSVEQVALRAAVYKTRCAFKCVCKYM